MKVCENCFGNGDIIIQIKDKIGLEPKRRTVVFKKMTRQCAFSIIYH